MAGFASKIGNQRYFIYPAGTSATIDAMSWFNDSPDNSENKESILKPSGNAWASNMTSALHILLSNVAVGYDS